MYACSIIANSGLIVLQKGMVTVIGQLLLVYILINVVPGTNDVFDLFFG